MSATPELPTWEAGRFPRPAGRCRPVELRRQPPARSARGAGMGPVHCRGRLMPAAARLDEVVHGAVRLRICGMLARLGSTEFVLLRDTLQVSDPTLSKHLKELEQAGYVQLLKGPGRAGRTRTRADLTGRPSTATGPFCTTSSMWGRQEKTARNRRRPPSRRPRNSYKTTRECRASSKGTYRCARVAGT